MKKLIALSLAILLLTGCTAAAYDGPTESAWVLTEMTTTQYDTFTGESQTRLQTIRYDILGNPVHNSFYTDGELTAEHKNTYDEHGNCIREVTWNHLWFFSYPVSRTSYTYDEQGRLLTTTYRNGLGIKTGSDTYTYDDEANTITWVGTYDTQIKYLDENGKLLRVVTDSRPAGMEMGTRYEYDELGRNTRILQYLDGELSMTTEQRFDDQDRVIESTMYDANGAIISRHTWEYTENTVTTWDMDGYKSVKTLRPDGLTEKNETYDPDGQLRTRMDYNYTEIQIPAKEE